MTGFEPFDGRTRNVSWDAVRAMDGVRVGDARVRVLRLPVVWEATRERIERAVRDPDDSVVLLVGFGEGRPDRIAIERTAHNRADTASRDVRGRRAPRARFVAGGAERFESALGVERLRGILARSGFEAEVSDDAGSFLCEEAYYHLADLAPTAPDGRRRALFVHLPPYPEGDTGGAHLARMRRAVRLVVDAASLER